MANQYTKLTRENILIKMNRKKQPVHNAAQLAREFGVNTTYRRTVDTRGRTGLYDNAVPASFRRRVIALVGTQVWNQLRNDESVNLVYR